MVESFSEDEQEEEQNLAENTPSEIRELLTRKVELEKRHRNQELHRQRVKVGKYFIGSNVFVFFRRLLYSLASTCPD